jgi:sulfite dehydrogenase (cytochrome) subunit B
MRTLRKMLPVLAGIALAATVPSGRAQAPFTLQSVSVSLPSSTRLLPPGPGAETANARCLTCHSAGMVLNQPNLSAAAWTAEVNKMRVVFKANLDPNDVPVIAAYLFSIKGAK